MEGWVPALVKRRYRLAILVSHPVPYHVPLYRTLAAHPAVDLTVWFCSRLGLTDQVDPEFGVPLKRDPSLLNGYRHRFLRNLSPLRTPGYFWGLINPGILPALFSEHYDAVLVHGYTHATDWLGFLAAWISGTPVFLRGETVLKKEPSWSLQVLAKKILLRGTRACLAVGTPSRLFYRAYRVPENKVFFSPYGVDNDFFIRESRLWGARRTDLKRELGIAPEIPVILFCGKLVPRKRPQDLLSAFEKLSQPAALLFVGEGSLRPSLEQRARGRSDVLFAGLVDQREIPKYYAIADVFVLPSEREVTPLVVNEAMACGLPVVLSDAIPSAVDFVKQGENGFSFPLGDIQALSSFLDCLLRDEDLRRRMGRKSMEWVRAWNPEAAAEGIVQALSATCA